MHFDDIASILEASKFDILEAVAREIRSQDVPFGGLQVRAIPLDAFIANM
jgi:hypothetical protein